MKVLRVKVTERGGGIEIDLGPEGYDNHRMTAYQNYLGGGILGSIQEEYWAVYRMTAPLTIGGLIRSY